MGSQKLRAAVYARVSTADQNHDLQIREMREFAARRGWIVREYIDHGVRAGETRRPRLAQLVEDLHAHRLDVVLVWKFDRAFRSVQHLVEFSELLKRSNVEFVSITERIDTTSPAGKLVFHVLAAIAEFERDLIRERVIAGIRAAQARGVKLGRPQKPVNESRIRLDYKALKSYAKVAGIHKISKSVCFAIVNGQRSERRARVE